jgi:hypothetical protein
MKYSDLLRPFSYLKITHPSGKIANANWKIPSAVSILLIAALATAFPDVNVWGETGIVSKFLQFIQTLPGFYIAALAAVATFGNESIDRLMPGIPPEKTVLVNNKECTIQLTRRLFLSSMFAYLTALSIALTVGIILLLALAPTARDTTPAFLLFTLKYVALTPVILFLTQLVTITLWGLYYLGERMHLSDS